MRSVCGYSSTWSSLCSSSQALQYDRESWYLWSQASIVDRGSRGTEIAKAFRTACHGFFQYVQSTSDRWSGVYKAASLLHCRPLSMFQIWSCQPFCRQSWFSNQDYLPRILKDRQFSFQVDQYLYLWGLAFSRLRSSKQVDIDVAI